MVDHRPWPVQIVACAGISLGWVAGLFESQAPPNGPPALTKMPCRWHCPHQRQGGGIHQHAAGNVLHSLLSSLPIGPISLLYLRSEAQDLFQSSLPRKAICFPAAQLNVKKIHV
jgi:hypothetical protein